MAGREDQYWKHPLAPLVEKWRDTIREGLRWKRDFDKQADTCMSYVKGPFDHIWKGRTVKGQFVEGDLEEIPAPSHQVDVNKAFEYKAIYGPMLYFRNPTYKFTPRKFPELPPELFGYPGDPAVRRFYREAMTDAFVRNRRNAGIGALISHYLNWAQYECDQKAESRKVTDEALLTGLGIWWHELWSPPGSNITMPIASWQTNKDIVIDPDSEDGVRGAMWIARRLRRPRWLMESERGLRPGSLPGTFESGLEQGANRRRKSAKADRNRGKTYDIQEYWEIYSKIGFGHHLRDMKLPAPTRQLLDGFGPFCRIEVAEKVPYPLNMHSSLLDGNAEDLFLRSQWPIPLHLDGRWPMDTLAFHWLPGDLYPTSPLEPALGELKFLSWGMSHLATKIRTSCRDFVAIAKAVGEELKAKVLHGGDMTLLEIERNHGKIGDVVQFLQHPEMNGDIWQVMAAMSQQVEQRLGLSPLLVSGQTPSALRSAKEADVKQGNISIRPDDMLSCVEDALSLVGRSQAMTCRFHITDQDVAPLLGPYGAAAWRNVMDADIETITRELEYRVEAGSTQKPNTGAEREFMQGAMTVMMPQLLEQARLFGDYTAVNNLMADWAKAHGGDPERYMLQPQRPLPQPGPAGQKKTASTRKAK